MKSWFVYIINGEKIGTWAQTEIDARKNMVAEYGDVPMEFIGIDYCGYGPQPEKKIRRGMSAVDIAIAFGLANMLVSLR